MKVLVTGTDGFIGSHFLLNETRLSCCRLNSCFRLSRHVNLDSEFLNTLAGSEVILHLAGLAHGKYSEQQLDCINHLATLQLANASAKAGIKRFVFVSTINVHGRSTVNAPFTELSSIDTSINISKVKAEEGLIKIGKDTGMEITIVRPVLVYGRGAPGNMGLIMSMVSKLPFTVLGALDNKKSFISVNNLCDFLYVCCTHPLAANEVFLVSDDNVVSTPELLSAMAFGLGKKVVHLPVPVWALRLVGSLVGKSNQVDQLIGHLEVDCSKAKNLLNWNPPETMALAMKKLM
jgi:nucleoside-diphosphate-sugar epimerase